MSDLVKRLRDTADFLSRASHEGQFPHIPGYSAGTLYEIAPHCTEAADRIERLEAFVEKVRNLVNRTQMVAGFDLEEALAELDKRTRTSEEEA